MGFIQTQAANCKNCYRCIRTCPVKAIEFRGSQAKVIDEECIACCSCLKECPQNAKTVGSDLIKVRRMLSEGERVIVSLAPSFAGFAKDTDAFLGLLHEIGFAEVRETAEAALEVSKQYQREYTAKGGLITTACPVVVDYVEKYAPNWLGVLAGVDSPMLAHAKWIKARDRKAKVVFIGPCYAKKREMTDHPGWVDAVLTFEEVQYLKSVPIREGRSAEASAQTGETNEEGEQFPGSALLYPAEGGVIETTFPQGVAIASSRYRAVSGMDNIIRLLASMEEMPAGYFLELNACHGGCLNGPAAGNGNLLLKQERLLTYTAKRTEHSGSHGKTPLIMTDTAAIQRSFRNRGKPHTLFPESQLRSVLDKIGKRKKEDELNCGACGYNSCRDKAAAVLAGKAELYMCMPYSQARAESFAHVLLEKTPNAVIAVTEQLLVKEVNEAAESFFHMEARLLAGLPFAFLVDPDEFPLSQTEQVRKRLYFPALHKSANVTASYVADEQLYLVIVHDLTEEEQKQEKLRSLKQETVEMAQKVIENQMRVAQEIAGLLGETTAETKVTLTKLKRLLLEE